MRLPEEHLACRAQARGTTRRSSPRPFTTIARTWFAPPEVLGIAARSRRASRMKCVLHNRCPHYGAAGTGYLLNMAESRPRLVVRALRKTDLKGVQEIQKKSFPTIDAWTKEQFESQLNIFPEGQLGVERDGALVAPSSSVFVVEEDVGAYHTIDQVSDNGFIRNHDPEGDTLYGIDIAVDPKHRGAHLTRRLYEARKEVSRQRNLRAILIAGRIPGYAKQADKMSAEEYVQRVIRKEFKVKDPVLTAQLAQGFSVRAVLKDYLPQDADSRGYAVYMEWLNPEHHPKGAAPVRTVRVASVQYEMRPITSFEQFAQQCEFFIDTAAEYAPTSSCSPRC
jgi:ribosomal protein S18 acetylase RimI-like enzyme